MEKFVVKVASEQEALFILSMAFEYGWKWFDDESAPKPNGQKLKNSQAPYLYFGYKGPGLISWFERVKKAIPPANVLNARKQLTTIESNLKWNTTLHIGTDEVEVLEDRVKIGCKTFRREAILEMLELSKRTAAIPGDQIFHANGDVTSHNRRVSAYLLQYIADEIL